MWSAVNRITENGNLAGPTQRITAEQALRAVTLGAAYSMQMENQQGSIEAGKLANMTVLDENPLDDIRNSTAIRYVMKNGELFEGETLTQVWPGHKAPQPFWWWKETPAGK